MQRETMNCQLKSCVRVQNYRVKTGTHKIPFICKSSEFLFTYLIHMSLTGSMVLNTSAERVPTSSICC